tara:strand:- start:846 stop:2777 length:1932 start_codon:yes stop_codon:yes gene_type:complete
MSIFHDNIVAGASGGGGEGLYAEEVFNSFIYEGTGSGTIQVQNGLDLSGEGGMVWMKKRNASNSHYIVDTERGKTKYNRPDASTAEGTASDYIDSFNSDGYTLGSNSNVNSGTHCAWSFRKAPGFFDVITYTGDGQNGRDIAHSLGTRPGMIWIAGRQQGWNWIVWHQGKGNDRNLELDNDGNGQNASCTVAEGNTTHFTLSSSGMVNNNGYNYVAYVFGHDSQEFGKNGDENIIYCGEYTGSGSDQIIDIGFEPQFLLIKAHENTSTNWLLIDSARQEHIGESDGTGDNDYYFNVDVAQNENYDRIVNFKANGFRLTTGANSSNRNGWKYIYMAIRAPHKEAESASDFFQQRTRTGTGGYIDSEINFRADWAWVRARNVIDPIFTNFRGQNRQGRYVTTNGASSPADHIIIHKTRDNFIEYSSNSGSNGAGKLYYDVFWKKCPGAFDMQRYHGTQASHTINHNLGATPQLIWICRTTNGSWQGTDAGCTPNKSMAISGTAAVGTDTNGFTGVSDTTFTLGNNPNLNSSGGSFVAFLWANLSGIIDIGTYSGTGNNIDVDCGFSSGAQFVIIKRQDSSGEWYFFNTALGLVAGNDTFFNNNSSNPNSSNDYIDPLNAGFTITSTAPTDLNTSGGTYLYMAIAA